MTVCAVLFDGPVLEQALPGDGSLGPLMALGVEEIILLQKVHQIIRASPGKAEGLFEKFRQILREEKKEELICNQCPGFNHRDEWDATQMRSSLLPPPSHETASFKTLQKRGIGSRRKVAKKEKKVAKKKDRQNMKPRKVERKQTGVENSNKRREFGKKEKHKEKKKNMKSKDASQKKKRKKNKKINKIVKMKQIKQRRKIQHGNRRTKNLEKLQELKCIDVWAELTNVGLGVATTLKKQVRDIDHVMKKMTGGTPEVRSDKSLTLLTFDI